METKNIILSNYAAALMGMISSLAATINTLTDNPDENAAIIKTLNVQIESVRSETVLIQGAIDNYPTPNE